MRICKGGKGVRGGFVRERNLCVDVGGAGDERERENGGEAWQ